MQKVSRFLSAKHDFVVGEDGACIEDSTVRTRALVRLTTRRGEYWADKYLGSRLHTIRTLKEAKSKVKNYCKEALEPLLKTGEILSFEIAPDGIYQDDETGSIYAELLLKVSEDEYVELSALPVGA